MQKVKIMLFDKFSVKEQLESVLRSTKVINMEYAFTYGILRHKLNDAYHYFKTKRSDTLIFGKVLTLETTEEDLILLGIIYHGHTLEMARVHVLKDVRDIYTCKYEVKGLEDVILFVSNDKSLRIDKHKKVNCGNFTKYLLV